MTPVVKVLERVTRVTPLGIRFRDPVTDAPVGDGLVVEAWRQDLPARRTSSVLNRANVHVFNRLPGLSEAERGAGDAKYWQTPPVQIPFLVEVRDTAGRFLPLRFRVNAPRRGVLEQNLFSSPARHVPAGMAVIRAQFRESEDGPAAKWTVLEALLVGERLARGIADEEGRVALIFAWPELGDDSAALSAQSWDIDLRARYGPMPRTGEVPDLASALGQPAANLWADSERTAPLGPVTLRFGEELVVRSHGPGGPLPSLFITPSE